MLPAEAPHCKQKTTSILSSPFLLIFRFVETGNVLFGTLFMKAWFLSCTKSAENMSPKWFVRFAEAPHCRIKRDIDRGRSFVVQIVLSRRRGTPTHSSPIVSTLYCCSKTTCGTLLVTIDFPSSIFTFQLDLLYKSHKFSKTDLEVFFYIICIYIYIYM